MIKSTHFTESELMLCSTCLLGKPVTEFRRSHAGSERRRKQCRNCYNESMRNYRAKKRDKNLTRIVRELSWTSNRSSDINRLVTLAMRCFGGLQGFAVEWVASVNAARAAGNHKYVLQAYQALLRLLVESSKNDPTPPIEELSDEELARELGDGLKQQLAEDPELAVLPLRDMGWTVVPPQGE